jgi:AraC-like DNA-binding protein
MQGEFVGLAYACFRVTPGRCSQPDTCCDLVFVDGALLLAGPSTRANAVPLTITQVHLVQIDTFSVHATLGIPICEITDRILPLAEIAPVLAQQLTETFSAGEAVSLVGALPRSGHPGPIEYAARLLGAGASVSQAADAANLSARQFERRFLHATGLRPRTYRRIARFRRAMQAAAQAAGFADQAHFSRDTRDFTRQSPTEFLRNVANVQDTKISLRQMPLGTEASCFSSRLG